MANGYSKEETFSYIALMSITQHANEAGDNVIELMKASTRGPSIANAINDLYKSGGIRKELFENDINALSSVISIDENQQQWIDKILTSDPAANADKVATPVAT